MPKKAISKILTHTNKKIFITKEDTGVVQKWTKFENHIVSFEPVMLSVYSLRNYRKTHFKIVSIQFLNFSSFFQISVSFFIFIKPRRLKPEYRNEPIFANTAWDAKERLEGVYLGDIKKIWVWKVKGMYLQGTSSTF